MKPHEYVILEISRERERQMTAKGWTHAHDDKWSNGALAWAAACYAMGTDSIDGEAVVDGTAVRWSRDLWPWASEWWKPKGRRRDLVRAAALIVAEIERLDRSQKPYAAAIEAAQS